jgi:hypothetical protein
LTRILQLRQARCNLTLSVLDVMNVVFRQVLQDGAHATLQPTLDAATAETEIDAQPQQQQ